MFPPSGSIKTVPMSMLCHINQSERKGVALLQSKIVLLLFAEMRVVISRNTFAKVKSTLYFIECFYLLYLVFVSVTTIAGLSWLMKEAIQCIEIKL